MKKLILIAIAFIGLQATAQQKRQGLNSHERGQRMMNLSAEEMATLQTKKMTLHLDLNKSQQDDIYKINLENATLRKTFMEARKAKKEAGNAERPSKEERLKMMNAKLDHQIANKAKVKKILNEEQYTKWERGQARKHNKTKEGLMGKKGEKGKRKQRQF